MLVGIEPDVEMRAAAGALGVFSEVVESAAEARRAADEKAADGKASDAGVTDGSIIGVVASPPIFLAQTMRELAGFCDLVMDVGSIKAPVVQELESAGPVSAVIVPCHPMAGSHERGAAAGQAELFDGRWVFVVPMASSAAQAVRDAHAFWATLGAKTQEIDPESHDREVAFTSHLPHLLASAYMDVRTPLPAAAGSGFLEFTRLAKANPEMWSQILVANRDAWRPLLRDYLATLEQIDTLLEEGDMVAVQSWLAARRENRLAIDHNSD